MRVWIYKEVSSAASLQELSLLTKKIVSLFGPIPLFLKNLMAVRELEILGGFCFFKKLSIKRDGIEVFISSSFWETRISFLINLLNDYKFVLRDGGKIFKLHCNFSNLKVLLIKIHEGLNND